MVRKAVNFAFGEIGLKMIMLAVFDFNHQAISCYKKVGFTEYKFKKNTRQFENEFWNVVIMKIENKI